MTQPTMSVLKDEIGLEPAVCYNNSSAIWDTWTADLWAEFEQRIIDSAINEWQNDCGTVSVPKDSIWTCVVAVYTAKHFIIPIDTLTI